MVLYITSLHACLNLTYKGIIWFMIPQVMVIFNDMCAYLFGIFFGKTPLIKLSPKKTWEGFLGGIVGAALVSLVTLTFLSEIPYFICPSYELSFKPFDFYPTCTPDRIFVEKVQFLFLGKIPIWLTWFQFHIIVLSVMASIVAPFGGFFASGLKRALKIKDFADTIPEHGGLTDRFDCAIFMSLLSYSYVFNVVYKATPSMSALT